MRPVVHFVLLGALLCEISRWLGDGAPGRPSLALDATATDVLRRDWQARSGRASSSAEWTRLFDDGLDEEVLYRAAQARGLDRDDPVVQARLVQDMRFLAHGAADDTDLYRDALGLGLVHSDLVVRRRLVERMRRLLQEPALADEPSDAELQAFLDAHPARFAAPARVHLAHVFLSRQRRGAALESDARRLLERLGPADVARAAALGDALPLPADLPAASAEDLATLFGGQFAAAVLALEPGRWQGPLASPYGLHLVWVSERIDATPVPLSVVRAQVRAALRDERAAAALRAGVRELRASYASAGTAR